MPSAVSRKDFLRFSGVGLTGVALLGAAGCGRRLGGNRDVVKFLTGTEETTIQERAVTEILVNRFEEQHPKYTLEREAIDPDEMSKVIPSRLRSGEPPDVFSFDTGPGLGGVLADSSGKYRLHRRRLSSWSRNTCKSPHSYPVDKRVVKVRTVDTLPSAGDSRIDDHPQESPAKRYITGGAGDAGGTLQRLSSTFSALS
jgi:hypothetical protein